MADFIDNGQLNNMDGILEVFDLSDKPSFFALEHLHDQLKKQMKKVGKKLCAVLVGNKVDLANLPSVSK